MAVGIALVLMGSLLVAAPQVPGPSPTPAPGPSPTPLPPRPTTSPTPIIQFTAPLAPSPVPVPPAPLPVPEAPAPAAPSGVAAPPVRRPAAVPPVPVPASTPIPMPAVRPGAPDIPGIEPHLLRIGDRVRAWRPGASRPLQGIVVAASASALTVTAGERAELVTFDEVSRLEVRRTRTRRGRGALIGLAVGLLASAFVVTEDVLDRDLDTGQRLAGVAAMGGLGAGLGALTGTFVETGPWRAVTIEPAPRPPDAAARAPAKGVRLTVSLTF